MNDCPNADMRDLLPDLVHGRLDRATRALVEAHVGSCADCRTELALLRDLRATFGATRAVDVSRIVASIPAYRTSAPRRGSGLRIAAAVTLLVAGGASVVVFNRTRPIQETVAQSAPSEQAAPRVDASDVGRGSVTVATRPETSSTRTVVPERAATAPALPHGVSEGRELAMAGSLIDLSDRELDALLRDIESLDALPSTDVEASMISPVSPTTPARATP
jgi:hypothetical protein